MSLAEFTGWIALALLAISFCTPVRSPKLNSLIGGYRAQLKIHHWVGMVATGFIAVHLLVLVVEYSTSLQLLIDLSDTSILTGWVATLFTGVVVAVAFRFRTTPYRRWRPIHLVLIFGFLAALLHALLVAEPGTLSEWIPMALAGLVGGLGIAMTVWIPQLPSFGAPYMVKEQSAVRPDVVTQTLVPVSPHWALRFSAGQFVFLKYCDPHFSKMWHPFTVVGFSDSGEFELLIKARGQDTNLLPDFGLSSPVKINGPFGESFWRSDKPQVWVAYGVGVAIFLAAARSMPDDMCSYVHFVYCEKNQEHLMFQTEFDALSVRRKNFSWEQHYGEGRDVIEQIKLDVSGWSRRYQLFRICGHPGFQESVKEILVAAGVDRKSIILEGVY